MGQSTGFGFSSLVATATLAFLMQLHVAAAAQKISPATSSLIPPALRDRLSPLTRRQVVYYGKLMKRGGANAIPGNVFSEFCESARLLCGASLHKSVWGAAPGGVIDAKAMSSTDLPTSETVSAPLFSGWLRRKSRMGETETEPQGLQQHPTMASMGISYSREKDLLVGAKVVLPPYLYEPSGRHGDELSQPSFLPAPLALSLPPFDSQHLSQLLQLFHIPSDSRMARQVKRVLGDCDLVQSLGKDNDFIISFCATSFEAMLNFASSMLSAPNNMIQALTNSKVVGRPGSQVTIVRMAQLATAHDAVDCHDFTFPFRVMGCHRIKDSKAFLVRLASEESLTMDLLVACHKNTTLFNPHSEAFFQLKSSPGHTDICHWLPNNDNMWIPL